MVPADPPHQSDATSSVSLNKQLVLSWFEAMSSGEVEQGLSLLHPEFRYFLPGEMPCAGWRDQEGFLQLAGLLGRFQATAMTLRVGAVTAEDDRVLLELESDCELINGNQYSNDFIMAMRLRDGKIVELKEFGDTLHVFQSFDTPEMRGEPKKRERHISDVTQTIVGAAPSAPSQAT